MQPFLVRLALATRDNVSNILLVIRQVAGELGGICTLTVHLQPGTSLCLTHKECMTMLGMCYSSNHRSARLASQCSLMFAVLLTVISRAVSQTCRLCLIIRPGRVVLLLLCCCCCWCCCVMCLQSATPKQVESLISGYQRLVDKSPGGMGAAYLAMAITQKGLQAPVGFEQQQQQ